MLSSVLGTKLKLEGTIRYAVITFFAEKSSYIAHNRKSSRQVLHIFRSEHGKHFFLHSKHSLSKHRSFDCFAFLHHFGLYK